MIVLAAIPFLIGVGLFPSSAYIGRALPPALATWLLTVLALTVSLTGGLVLSLVASVSLAQTPLAGRLGHWSSSSVRSEGPPVWLGVVTALVVVALLSAAARRGLRGIRAVALANRSVRGLELPESNLVLLDHGAPTAYAVGGIHRRIVVSTSMLRALPANERRVLLAHEAARIRHHHYLFVQLCAIAAAANPFLRTSVVAVRASVERWADESAARDVGDRKVAARSLARAAMARAVTRPPAGALGGVDGDVVLRVRALMTEAPRHRSAALQRTGRRGDDLLARGRMVRPACPRHHRNR